MPGIKGRSGRLGFYDEQMVKKIIGSANNIILNTLEGKGRYADVSDEVKIEIASRFALKAIPQAVEYDGSEVQKNIINNVLIQVGGLTTEELRRGLTALRDRALPARAA